MCIAIAALPGNVISDEHLLNSYKNNPDGCGFAYINTDVIGVRRLKIEKTMDYDTFLKKYKRAVKNHPESPFLIHFRIATHGTVDKFNCHPFKIKKDLVFIHNGVIGGVGQEKSRSDTQLFNDNILKKLPKGWESNDAMIPLIEKFIGHSKMITLSLDGTVSLYNESSGHWVGDVWYSNYTYSYQPKINTVANVVRYDWSKSKPASSSMYLCEGCGVMHEEFSCHFFHKNRKAICYCSDCVDVAYSTGAIDRLDKVGKYKFIQVLRDGSPNPYPYAGTYE